jgi:hypothetical protein
MKKASVKGQKKFGPLRWLQIAARGTGTFFWQTPMVQLFGIVCTATCASGWRNLPT